MKIFRIIRELLCRMLEYIVMIAMGLLVLAVLWQVATRICGDASKWSEEAARFLLIWSGLLGASVGFSRKAHLGIDYLVLKADKVSQRLIEVVAQLIVLLFSVGVMIYGGGFIVV